MKGMERAKSFVASRSSAGSNVHSTIANHRYSARIRNKDGIGGLLKRSNSLSGRPKGGGSNPEVDRSKLETGKIDYTEGIQTQQINSDLFCQQYT